MKNVMFVLGLCVGLLSFTGNADAGVLGRVADGVKVVAKAPAKVVSVAKKAPQVTKSLLGRTLRVGRLVLRGR